MTLDTGGNEPPDGENLRCEYETSETHVGMLTSGVWESAAIVVGGSIAALAVLLVAPDRQPVAVGIAVFAIVAIAIIAMWRYNWSRHKFFIDRRWARMRDIERVRGMSTNTMLYALAESIDEGLPEPPGVRALKLLGQGKIRDKIRSKLLARLPRSGQDVLHGTALLVQWGWILMAAFKLVDAFFLAESTGVHHFHP